MVCALLQVRVENLKDPADYIPAVLERVKVEYLQKTYHVSSWTDATNFLEQLAARMGRLLKVRRWYFCPLRCFDADPSLPALTTLTILQGGEPDVNTVAKVVLSDFQRGKLPYFVPPPPLPKQPATVSSILCVGGTWGLVASFV